MRVWNPSFCHDYLVSLLSDPSCDPDDHKCEPAKPAGMNAALQLRWGPWALAQWPNPLIPLPVRFRRLPRGLRGRASCWPGHGSGTLRFATLIQLVCCLTLAAILTTTSASRRSRQARTQHFPSAGAHKQRSNPIINQQPIRQVPATFRESRGSRKVMRPARHAGGLGSTWVATEFGSARCGPVGAATGPGGR